MIRLRVKNFGPIRKGMTTNDRWIEFKRVTIFVGNQGSGKSTLAKLFSTFSWIEKALVRGDYDKKWFERKNRLSNQFLTYHRLENYFSPDTPDEAEIEYEGDAFSIKYSHGQLRITALNEQHYALPQVMYVPAERNFIAYVRHPKELKLSSDALKEFLAEFDNAKNSMKGTLKLPINNTELEYDKLNDILNIRDNAYKLRLTDASSGFQSAVPLYLVSHYLAHTIQSNKNTNQEPMSSDELERFRKGVAQIFSNVSLTQEQQRAALSVLSSKFNKTAFINIVEEPEQNLYPLSQWKVLQSLLMFNNKDPFNRLVLTTHSPYIVNYLSIAVQGELLHKKILNRASNVDLLSKLEALIPLTALVSPDELAIYQSDEITGSIIKLETLDGIPADENYLNNFLREGNFIFDKLLELEEELDQ